MLAQSKTKGDPELGAAIAARACVACHTPEGTSPIPATPRLAGQHASYLIKQIRDYREGRRSSEIMVSLLADLSDEDIAHVSAYFATKEPLPGAATDPSLLPLGRSIYLDGDPDRGVPSCSGCHGDDGEGTRRFPRLAGQDIDYMIVQMRHFAAGERTNDRGLMQTVADRLSEAETLAVAQFTASLTGVSDTD